MYMGHQEFITFKQVAGKWYPSTLPSKPENVIPIFTTDKIERTFLKPGQKVLIFGFVFNSPFLGFEF